MVVYVVLSSSEYGGDSGIEFIFEDLEKAEQYIKHLTDMVYEIQEHEVLQNKPFQFIDL